MPIDDQTLSKLLRLKKYEQPHPGYFEDFLSEFQSRQRAELLRRSAWRIAVERLETFFGQYLTLSQVSYAAASLVVLCVAGTLTFTMLQHPGSGVRSSVETLAANTMQAPHFQQVASVSKPANMNAAFTPQIRIPDALMNPSAQPMPNGQHPRYILDTRPASYEPPFSF
jgi:hypothetical protein